MRRINTSCFWQGRSIVNADGHDVIYLTTLVGQLHTVHVCQSQTKPGDLKCCSPVTSIQEPLSRTLTVTQILLEVLGNARQVIFMTPQS